MSATLRSRITPGMTVINDEDGWIPRGTRGTVMYDRGTLTGIRVRWDDGRESWMSPALLVVANTSRRSD